MKTQKTLATLLFTMLGLSSAARADDFNIIDLQFGGASTQIYTGSGPSPYDPMTATQWNFMAGASYGNFALKDSTGASSGVQASLSSTITVDSPNPVPLARIDGSLYGNLLDNYIGVGAGTEGYITLSGLSAGALYNLTVITQPDSQGGGRETTFTFNGANSVTTAPASASQDHFQVNVNYVTGNYYASSSGTIQIGFDAAYNEADINGLQLEEIAAAPSATPEPGTVSMMLGGALLTLGAARRKSRSA